MADLTNEKDQEVFKEVSETWEQLRKVAYKQAAFTPVDTLGEWLSRLTGDFMYLTTRYNSVRVARHNNEVAKYIELKRDSGDSKFVSAVAEREARNSVSAEAQAEHVFESYKEAAEQGILTIKKLLDVFAEERKQER